MPKLHYIESAESTNLSLQALCQSQLFENGEAVYTTNQTKGRGQRGNVWVSESGQNILFSMVYTPEQLPVKQQFRLTQWVAISVVDFFRSYNRHFQIKWPNDLYACNQKMGGILIENTIRNANIENSIIGIGLNINQTTFPDAAPNAISLKLLTNQEYNLHTMAETFHKKLFYHLSTLEKYSEHEVQETYWKHLYRNKGLHPFRDASGTFEAEIVGFTELGLLRLKTTNGEERQYDIKEVVFL